MQFSVNHRFKGAFILMVLFIWRSGEDLSAGRRGGFRGVWDCSVRKLRPEGGRGEWEMLAKPTLTAAGHHSGAVPEWSTQGWEMQPVVWGCTPQPCSGASSCHPRQHAGGHLRKGAVLLECNLKSRRTEERAAKGKYLAFNEHLLQPFVILASHLPPPICYSALGGGAGIPLWGQRRWSSERSDGFCPAPQWWTPYLSLDLSSLPTTFTVTPHTNKEPSLRLTGAQTHAFFLKLLVYYLRVSLSYYAWRCVSFFNQTNKSW